MPTKIEWTDETWNPVTGCTKVSEGCQNCYAERMAKRLAGRSGYPKENPFAVTLHKNRVKPPYPKNHPMSWRKPRRIFVCSMGALFHEDVQAFWVDEIFTIMAVTPRHTYIVLTKRPGRLRGYISNEANRKAVSEGILRYDSGPYAVRNPLDEGCWPPPNVWLGVSVENQARADERIPILLDIPAAVRFVSIEPMLGPVDLSEYLYELDLCPAHDYGDPGYPPSECSYCKRRKLLDWVIVGGESGPGARPIHPDWARSVRDQCIAAGVPFFFKQWGAWGEIAAVRYVENDERYTTMGKYAMKRYGKKYSGRLLDGREWNEWPEVK